MSEIYKNELIYIKIEKNQIPWLKIFTNKQYKELTDCDIKTRNEIYKSIEIIEKAMLDFYKPEKINIAMFGNYVAHFHAHVMARFKNDNFFPEPMWGKQQRDDELNLAPMEDFISYLLPKLEL